MTATKEVSATDGGNESAPVALALGKGPVLGSTGPFEGKAVAGSTSPRQQQQLQSVGATSSSSWASYLVFFAVGNICLTTNSDGKTLLLCVLILCCYWANAAFKATAVPSPTFFDTLLHSQTRSSKGSLLRLESV